MTTEISALRRYLAVYLPWLPAERAMRANVAPRDAAFALTAAVGGGVRVVAVSAAADAGLVGLPIADARARTPALAVVVHDAAADLALLEWIADGCEIFSPTVALDPPDGVIIDVTGCRAEFAEETDLVNAVTTRLRRHGLTPVTAIAPTPDAAVALARFAVATVDDLPLAALRIDAELRQALGRSGLSTIGALAARPRAPLAARFGAIVPTLLARLLGEDVRLVPRRSPSQIVAEQRFAEPVTSSMAVRKTLDRLTTIAAEQLTTRGVGGRRVEAALFRSDGHVARLAIDTGAPTRDPKVLTRLLAERIDALADPLDPGFGYDLIRLTVPVTEALGPAQPRLDAAVSGEAEITVLIDRLTTRLGRDRVRRLVRGDSHIPERAAFDLQVAAQAATWPVPAPGEPSHRPLQLFAPPQPIEVIAEVPDGSPRRFRWQRLRHEVARAEGPERIAAEWWGRRDGRGTTRDYYRLEDVHGRRFWVFRHGLYGVEQDRPRWYLHGIFA